MVSLIALILIVNCDQIKAVDSALGSSSDLRRLDYYPHAEKIYLSPSLIGVPSSLSIAQKGASPGNTSNSHSWEIGTTVIYGLPIEGLRVGLSGTWTAHHWTNVTSVATGAVTQTSLSGLSDPSLNVQYRVSGSNSDRVSGDLSISISPSFLERQVATAGVAGTSARGYGTATITETGYWILEKNDFEASLNLTRNFSGNGVNLSTPTASYTRTAYLSGSASLVDRYHVLENLYLQGSVNLTLPESYSQTNSASPPVSVDLSVPFHVTPGLAIGYRCSARFVTEFLYSYQNYTTTSTPVKGADTDTHLISTTLTLRARMEF